MAAKHKENRRPCCLQPFRPFCCRTYFNCREMGALPRSNPAALPQKPFVCLFEPFVENQSTRLVRAQRMAYLLNVLYGQAASTHSHFRPDACIFNADVRPDPAHRIPSFLWFVIGLSGLGGEGPTACSGIQRQNVLFLFQGRPGKVQAESSKIREGQITHRISRATLKL